MAAYTLVVMTNPVEGREQEYNDWYNNQHLADVLRVPGFSAARRFKMSEGFEGPHAYMALYEMETDDPAKVIGQLTELADTSAMPISKAMDMNVGMTLFKGITPIMRAQG